MKMNERRIKSAKTMIKVAVILRLSVTAVLMLGLAYAYTDERENLLRSYQGTARLYIVIFGFFLDTLLAILWLYSPKIFKLHLVLNLVLGCGLYGAYVVDFHNATGMGASLVAFFKSPFIWLIGLVPFIICEKGNSKLKMAEIAQNRET